MTTQRELAQWQALFDGLGLARFGVGLEQFRSDPHAALVVASRHPSWPEFARRHVVSATELAKPFTDPRRVAHATAADRARGTALHAAHDAVVRRYQSA